MAQIKWLPFCRRPFQINFLEWKILYFDSNVTSWSLFLRVPVTMRRIWNRWHNLFPWAIIGTKDGLICWRIYASSGLTLLNIKQTVCGCQSNKTPHWSDVIMSSMAPQITSVSIACWTVCSGADQRKHQSSASPAFVRGIHRWPVDSPHKGPVTWKMFPFDDVTMTCAAETVGNVTCWVMFFRWWNNLWQIN